MNENSQPSDEKAWDHQLAKTLAAWCAKSSESYNVGAYQTALLLMPTAFLKAVGEELAELDLSEGASNVWARYITPSIPPEGSH